MAEPAAPIVSVVIPMRDRAATIEAAIRSILFQTMPDWELILIDDGSRDDGPARVAAFGDPRINLIRHESSRGISCRRNQGTRLARGEFIAIMDSDDVCYPERFAVQVEKLRSDPTIDLLASNAVVFRRHGEAYGIFLTPQTHERIAADPYAGFFFPHPTWCGRSDWFRQHPYDERLPTAMDQDLLLRTAASSRFAAVDKILLGYRKERIHFTKNLLARTNRSRALWRYAVQADGHRRAAKEIAASFAEFAADIVTIGLGGGERLLHEKIPPLSNPEDIAKWHEVWRSVS